MCAILELTESFRDKYPTPDEEECLMLEVSVVCYLNNTLVLGSVGSSASMHDVGLTGPL